MGECCKRLLAFMLITLCCTDLDSDQVTCLDWMRIESLMINETWPSCATDIICGALILRSRPIASICPICGAVTLAIQARLRLLITLTLSFNYGWRMMSHMRQMRVIILTRLQRKWVSQSRRLLMLRMPMATLS